MQWTALLLPGMDGTGKLFKGFVRALPKGIAPEIVSYPADEALGYDELLALIKIPDMPFAVVAESFSGPLAVRLAAQAPRHLKALVLVATFVRKPVRIIPRWMRILVTPKLFKVHPPDWALRWALMGGDRHEDITSDFQEILKAVRPEVFALRLREILNVDVSREFSRLSIPLLYVAGRRDRLVSQRVAKGLAKLHPGMETVTLDAPHLVLQSQPLEAATAISGFLARA